ncbi:hypothetical protein GCM10009416_42240 [Craurococcus roseus]|uniref:DUF305 domain-containing protein n=1 Tax=Craurococcus roseus TaxID=77585 RepID=A0ABP3R3K2_9PROT
MTPTQRRTLLLSLAPLVAAGCGGRHRMHHRAEGTVRRFAAALDGAEEAVDGLISRMDAFERDAAAEEEAIAFATGGAGGRGTGGRASRGEQGSRFTPAPAGAADAAGRVLDAAFAALEDYSEVLAQAASGRRVVDAEGLNGQQLARATESALDALRRSGGGSIPDAERRAGLQGIAALADLPQAIARQGRRPTESAVVAEAQPHVAATAALLRAAIGAGPGQGARGAIAVRQSRLDASQGRLLAAIRRDRSLGPTARYEAFRSIAEARDDDPDEEAFDALLAMIAATEQAHAALGTGGPDAEAKVAAFELAVLALRSYNEASRRG